MIIRHEENFRSKIWRTSSSVLSWYENMVKRWTSRRSRDVYLFRMFLDHDETCGMGVSYDFSNLWANLRVNFLFTIVGLVIQIVTELFFTTKLIVFKLRLEFYVIIYLIDHHNNALIVFFYTCRSAQLNMNRYMCEQEWINCLISNMRMRLPTICYSDFHHFLSCLHLALDWRSRLMHVTWIFLPNQMPDENTI